MLHGRESEQREIDRLIAGARTGRSGVLLVRGEAGIGKTALLEYAAGRAADLPVLRVLASVSEARLPFAALHLLLRPALGHLDRLPAPQAAALKSALGLTSAAEHDKFLIGLAVLTLMSEFNAEGPLLCLIDDAQWLDEASAEALLFAARRFDAEGIVMLAAVRDGWQPLSTEGLPDLELRRLNDEAAGALLADRTDGLAPQVRQRVLAGAEGNPLALIELPKALTPEQRAGRLGPLLFDGGTVPPFNRVQSSFQARVRRLPESTQDLLRVAATDDTGDLGLVIRAADRLGCSALELGPAERSDLIHISEDRLVFRHPLIRAAIYQGATYAQRVATHLALAEVLEGSEHADRRAWHLAAAASGPDERVAAELERAALRARERQATAAASAAYERAAQLTGDERQRSRRLVAAAELAIPAGQLGRAYALAREAAALATDPPDQAGLARVCAAVEFEQGSPQRAGRMLVEAATQMMVSDPDGAAFLLVGAVRYASFGGDNQLARDARAGLERVALSATPRFRSLAGGMAAMADFFAGELDIDLTSIHEAVQAVSAPANRWEMRLLAASLSIVTGDNVSAEVLAASVVESCREHSMFGVLPHGLVLLAQAQLARGRHREALVSTDEACRIAQDIGQGHRVGHVRGVLAWLAAAAGDEARCQALARETIEHARSRGIVTSQAMAFAALGLLDLGLGRPEAALGHLEDMACHPITALYYAADQVEAAVRADLLDRAKEPLTRLEEWSRHAGQTWLEAMAARCRALVSSGEEAERHYQAAMRLHGESDQPFEQARTALLYGEWLRRGRRRGQARVHLRAALAAFELLGAAPWAARARAELHASGEAPDEATGPEVGDTDPFSHLTPQEGQVVRLAAVGATSREIAAQLFLSPRTVEYHLYKAFPKLGVSSRAELADLRGAEKS
jgi:DNA-binding CsgD family transcriptional regulator